MNLNTVAFRLLLLYSSGDKAQQAQASELRSTLPCDRHDLDEALLQQCHRLPTADPEGWLKVTRASVVGWVLRLSTYGEAQLAQLMLTSRGRAVVTATCPHLWRRVCRRLYSIQARDLTNPHLAALMDADTDSSLWYDAPADPETQAQKLLDKVRRMLTSTLPGMTPPDPPRPPQPGPWTRDGLAALGEMYNDSQSIGSSRLTTATEMALIHAQMSTRLSRTFSALPLLSTGKTQS